MSSPTFLIVLCKVVSRFLLIGASTDNFSCNTQTLSKNLRTPTTPLVLQAHDCSNGPINISYKRIASAPNSPTTSSGLTTLFQRLLILRPSSARIKPTLRNFVNGSGLFTTPMSYKNLCQKR